MPENKYLDSAGLAVLWERIKELVYTCAGKNVVTYRLVSDGSTVTLVGSDGSRSSVVITATADCGE